MCNLRVPSRFRARLWIGLHANEESVCEGDALVGWQDQGVVRECIECRRHGIRYDRKRRVSTRITARERLARHKISLLAKAFGAPNVFGARLR